jgi:hypothetical protein
MVKVQVQVDDRCGAGALSMTKLCWVAFIAINVWRSMVESQTQCSSGTTF